MAKFKFTEAESEQILLMVRKRANQNYKDFCECLLSNRVTNEWVALEVQHTHSKNLYELSNLEEATTALLSVLKAGDESLEAFNFEDGMYNLLQLAAASGDVVVTQLLLQKGFDAKVKGGIMNDSSLLHLAANNGRADVAVALLKHSANIDELDSFKQTPICVAAGKGHFVVVEVLLSSGANLNYGNITSPSALFNAVHNACSDVAALLVGHKADVNKISVYGATPLSRACGTSHQQSIGAMNCIKALLTSETPVIITNDKQADCVIRTLEYNPGFVPTKCPTTSSPEKQKAIASIIKLNHFCSELNYIFAPNLKSILYDLYGDTPHIPDSMPVTGEAMSD